MKNPDNAKAYTMAVLMKQSKKSDGSTVYWSFCKWILWLILACFFGAGFMSYFNFFTH